MNKNLQNWVFHLNPYTDKWSATTRDNYNALFNGENEDVLTSGDIHTLVYLIEKTNGDKEKLKKLTNGK